MPEVASALRAEGPLWMPVLRSFRREAWNASLIAAPIRAYRDSGWMHRSHYTGNLGVAPCIFMSIRRLLWYVDAARSARIATAAVHRMSCSQDIS
jgi:hypothetical protein